MATTDRQPNGPPDKTLLVVDADPLLQWSLAAYLGRWFEVISTDSEADACRVIEDRPVDAVVVSDDLDGGAADKIEARAFQRNPSTRIVRTITNPSSGGSSPCETRRIEKPFRLSQLAELLGVCVRPNVDETRRVEAGPGHE